MEGVWRYVNGVANGDIVAGELVKMSVQRFVSDTQRTDIRLDTSVVNRCFRFIGLFKHFKGKHSGEPFVLADWERFIVANIVGWYVVETGRRRYTSSYIEVARKQGKTALASALCLYFLFADGEAGAEVILSANSKEQASIAYDFCRTFATQLDPKKKSIRDHRSIIYFDATKSHLKVIASDDSTQDGFNASFGLVDEYHSAPDTSIRDVIVSSMGMRENPHLCTITTAGFNKHSVCYKLRNTCVEVLHGVKTDDNTFIVIYALDADDDWQDEAVWAKSNPNLGETVTKEYLRTQVTSAINTPSNAVGVLTKNLNMWCDSESVWINSADINKATKRVVLSRFTTDNSMCYIGVDLASVSDLTAVAFVHYHEGRLYATFKYYLPETCLHGKENSALYTEWARLGLLTLTAGNVTDYDYITNDLVEASRSTTIVSIMYDPYNATQWAIDATEIGLPLEEYPQNIGNFNRPTRELERLILSNRITIDDNEITRFCFANVVMKEDYNGNQKPAKTNGKNKIDGVIALIEAIGGILRNPPMLDHDFSA